MDALKAALLSALHNSTALFVASVVPYVASALQQGPTGNALVYAQSHPLVAAGYAIAALVARDVLKSLVPAFASAANPQDAAAH